MIGVCKLEQILSMIKSFHSFFLRFYLVIFRERGKEGERERNINVWLPFTRPLLGTWPTTQARALTGNQTRDPLVYRLALNALSHSGQNSHFILSHSLKCEHKDEMATQE